jgi:putative ABC transport system ATP-binding protein
MGLELQWNISTQEMLNRSRAMLEKVGLGNKLNYYLASLSGVQKERVTLTLAISQSAENCLP